MPVTVRPAPHLGREFNPWMLTVRRAGRIASDARQLLRLSCKGENYRDQKMLQSSFGNLSSEAPTYSTKNGFVLASIEAYRSHLHLRIRPEDVWFSILTQLGFFVKAHSEELRSFFVSHEGRKQLKVFADGAIETVDFGKLAIEMTKIIEKNVVDPELRAWVMPNFSTTTDSDKVVAAILMMGALQSYFDYVMHLECGIPSVTLLGTRADWEEMLNRLEMLPRLGSEPMEFYNLLKPVLRYFVDSFDSPSDSTIIDFWQKIAHYHPGGSGPSYVSGWITAFCFWDADGKRLFTPPDAEPDEAPTGVLNGVLYHRLEMDRIPIGHASVPVRVEDGVNGITYKTRMVAGSVGISISSSGELLEGEQRSGLDSLQPVSGWWMYVVEELSASSVQSKSRKHLPFALRLWRGLYASRQSP